MALNAGTKLGPYEILSPLGAGGMGEVYRARDTRLGREVAIKVLPELLASDAERMARFQREAQVLASLNHPNIAAIHGLEDSGGVRGLVMELIEGPTLADRIARGPIPFDEALPLAKQIAEALEYAHEKGIIHRDLKPANVKVTPEGSVKVLDFGLAKALDVDGSSSSSIVSNSPTLTAAATQAGVILGTAAYMSPEQARGKPADRRADIWAFGCVLFEMISGKRTFEGETVSDVLARVIMKDPDWDALPSRMPSRIRRLLGRCFEKDPKRRLQAIGEARIAIEETLSGAPDAASGFSSPPTDAALEGGATWRRALPWAVAAVLLIATIVSLAEYFRVARASAGAIIAEISPPPKGGFVFDPLNGATPELSPDGRRLAFVASGADAKTHLWLRSLDSTESQQLEGTTGAMSEFWSPDSRYLGFFADGKLKKIEISGGAPVEVCDAAWGRGGSWSSDGTIVFAPNINSPIFRVPSGGGTPVVVTTLDPSRRETSHRWPQFLPDGHHFIFYVSSSSEGGNGTYVASLDGGTAKLVLKGDWNAIYAGGYFLFLHGGNLMAEHFDTSDLQLTGDAQAIANNVGDSQIARRIFVTSSREDTLAYWTGGVSSGNFQLLWYDRDGKQVANSGNPGFLAVSPRISPDGKQLAVQMAHVGGYDVWLYDLGRGVRTRLTFEPGVNAAPVWSPDGTKIAFSSTRSGSGQIYEKSANGTGASTSLLKDKADDTPRSWSPDGKYLAYDSRDPQRNSSVNIWVLPLFGGEKPFPFLTSQFNQRDPVFSPDGKWLAYSSDESGREEIYIAPFPKGNGKWEVSTNGGSVPRWRQDGKELFYLAADAKLMVTEIQEKGDSIKSDSPRPLFQTNTPSLAFRPYDVTADGKRFVVVSQTIQAGTAPITLVVNWRGLLRQP